MREAATKSYFFSGPATMGGGGGAWPLRKKYFFNRIYHKDGLLNKTQKFKRKKKTYEVYVYVYCIFYIFLEHKDMARKPVIVGKAVSCLWSGHSLGRPQKRYFSFLRLPFDKLNYINDSFSLKNNPADCLITRHETFIMLIIFIVKLIVKYYLSHKQFIRKLEVSFLIVLLLNL